MKDKVKAVDAGGGNAPASIDREFKAGKRFRFGKNWALFLKTLNDERIKSAENSLLSMLEISNLKGLSFLDAGSGSGLFSLAARKQGASVMSFDYDPQSVECTRELKRLYFDGDGAWKIEQGSVLDRHYLGGLGSFDIVYSWGVLHHSGDMWAALDNMIPLVKPGGKLYIAIYNDQGPISKVWRSVKKIYNKVPSPVQLVIAVGVAGILYCRGVFMKLLQGELPPSIKKLEKAKMKNARGMSIWRDLIDWVGGYPFEVAKPEEIFNHYKKSGFMLCMIKTCAGAHGCNEFVFKKNGG